MRGKERSGQRSPWNGPAIGSGRVTGRRLLLGGPVQVWPGQPYPLGATYDGVGTNFSLFSEVAERVELCLFDEHTDRERRLDMPEADGYVWHCFLPGVGPGQRYGYRVHRPHDPDAGLRCNPSKLLLDPLRQGAGRTGPLAPRSLRLSAGRRRPGP